MKILGFQISGQTVGIDIHSWGEELGDSKPFIVIEDEESITSGYTDVSSITSWGWWGHEVDPRIDPPALRDEIKKFLTPAQLTGNTSGFTADELLEIQEHKLDSYFKIYEYIINIQLDIDVQESPENINYDILGLKKKRTFNKGMLERVEYYGEYDFATNTFTDLILEENRQYFRQNEMVYRRELDITWYLNNNLSGATKHHTKYYTQEESIGLGERRRRNVISRLKMNTVGLIMAASGITQLEAKDVGRVFITDFNPEISIFVEAVEAPLQARLMSTTDYPWLDAALPMLGGATVRQFLYSEITYDYTINNTYV